ncbi:cyclase family protein [Streptomyces sp. NPDC058297]|uniref:cyclase family protein n=1 Tax=Streptomyces sp. NPDC058297 TaxID=3346433 RepID=UPI0036E5611F
MTPLALSHIFYRGRMWNGYSAAEHTSRGAARNGIQHWSDRLVLRGVLVDLPAHHGVSSLDPGYAITADDLEEALSAQGCDLRPGDALLVRTGQTTERRGSRGDYAGGPAPGLSLHTAPWLYEWEIAAVATDTWGVEVRPNETDALQPLHLVALVHMGLAFGEMLGLDALAADCAADRRYEFMLAASPLPITGGCRNGRWPIPTGSGQRRSDGSSTSGPTVTRPSCSRTGPCPERAGSRTSGSTTSSMPLAPIAPATQWH